MEDRSVKLWMLPPGVKPPGAAPARYYLVPDDLDWPDGDDAVDDVLGRRRGVDLHRLAPYGVSAAEAQRFSEVRTAELNARLGDVSGPPPALVEQLEADLSAISQHVDEARVRSLLDSLGLPLDRLVADPEATATLWAEVVVLATRALQSPLERKLFPSRLGAQLARAGYPEAARKLRQAPATVGPFLEHLKTLAEGALRAAGEPASPGADVAIDQKIYLQNLAGARVFLDLVRGELKPDQIERIEEFIAAGEPLMAFEMGLQYVDVNDGYLDPDAVAHADRFLERMGSDRRAGYLLRA